MRARVILTSAILMACIFLSCRKENLASYWPTGDWQAISPKKVGMDERLLAELAFAQNRLPKITSVLAVRHGYIVYEQYFASSATELREGYAITQSVLSCLVGIAIKQRKIDSLDQRMVDFFQDNKLISSDPIAQTITLRHLMTMSDGIRASGNMIDFYFSDPKISKRVTGEPGARFNYNDMSAQIVALILAKSTGKAPIDYAKQELFEPLGINDIAWNKRTVNGVEIISGVYNYITGLGLMLTARDFAKIGYLFLRSGKWDNKELIPAKWVADSTAEQIETRESSDYFRQYGYYWWVHTFSTHSGYFALGWGGQVICVVPELDLVVVVTSRESGHQHESGMASIEGAGPKYIEMIEKYIIASIRK